MDILVRGGFGERSIEIVGTQGGQSEGRSEQDSATLTFMFDVSTDSDPLKYFKYLYYYLLTVSVYVSVTVLLLDCPPLGVPTPVHPGTLLDYRGTPQRGVTGGSTSTTLSVCTSFLPGRHPSG